MRSNLLFALGLGLGSLACGATDVLPVEFARGPLSLHHALPQGAAAKARIVFGSGDGGWTDWEETMADWLAGHGWEVLGIDLREYAATDYDIRILGHDYAAAAAAGKADPKLPLFYGGWSMGAVQAVAAAADPGRPAALKGLLLLSADSRGRFGLRALDELGVTPTGEGTFGLSDMTEAVRGLRIAQWHGGADLLSSEAWVRSLGGNTALYELPGANHGFDGLPETFRPAFVRSLDWLLGDRRAAPRTAAVKLPWGLSPLWPGALLVISLALVFLFARRTSLRLIGGSVALVGALTLLEAIMPKPPDVIEWMQHWLPLGVSEKTRPLLLFSGLALLGLARGLSRGKRAAWWCVVVLLIWSTVLHLARAFDWHHSLAALLLLLPLMRWRRSFQAMSDVPTLRLALWLAPVMAVTLLAYGIATIRHQSEQGAFGEALPWSRIVKVSACAMVGLRPESQSFADPDLEHVFDLLAGTGAGAALVLLVLSLRPVLARRALGHDQDELKRAQAIIEHHGDDPLAPYALLPDKHYHWSSCGGSLIAYAAWRDFAVVLGEPLGPPGQQAQHLREFIEFCRCNDWVPLFYNIRQSSRSLFEELGLITFKVGEDARIRLADFSLAGAKFQNLRTARNKALKEGMRFLWYQPAAEPDHGLEAQLALVSAEWLDAKHGGEMGFDLGAFDLEWIRRHGCAVVLNAEGRVECFATWHRYDRGRGRVIDLMRSRASARGLMDHLILESMDRFRAEGVEEICLGNAPLANTEQEHSQLSRQERQVRLLFEHFDHFYGYKSLFNFKRKYQPEWRGRYLAYPPGTLLASIGLAVAAVHLPRGLRGLLKS